MWVAIKSDTGVAGSLPSIHWGATVFYRFITISTRRGSVFVFRHTGGWFLLPLKRFVTIVRNRTTRDKQVFPMGGELLNPNSSLPFHFQCLGT